MKQVSGFWVPDREDRVSELLGRSEQLGFAAYQRDKVLTALQVHRDRDGSRFGNALDVGAHIGLWSLQLLEVFDHVVAFEPDPEKHACYQANLEKHNCADRATLHKLGLSDTTQNVSLNQKGGTSLKTHVNLKNGGDIPLRRLDDLGIDGIDFMKMDIEGFELYALRGAEQTLRKNLPTIIIEQKPGVASKRYGQEDQAALRLLESWGYVIRAEMNGDFVMTPQG